MNRESQRIQEVAEEFNELLISERDWDSWEKYVDSNYGPGTDATAIWENQNLNLVREYATLTGMSEEEAGDALLSIRWL